mgnify:CR=1 FL=1
MANQVVNIDVEIGTQDLTKLDSLLKETGIALKGVETNLNDVGNSVNDVVAGLGEVGAGAKDIAKVEDAAVSASKGAGKLADETKKVGKASKDAGKEATIFGDIKDKFNDMTKGVKKVIVSMKTLKGAIAATGIGALLIAFASLVAYFKTSEEGSKKLAIATETLSLLFGKLVEFLGTLGEGLVNAFSNPLESIKALGMAIVNNVVERIVSLLDAVKFLGSALVKVFKGDFSGAMDDVKSAGSEMVDVMTGVDDSVTKIGETSKKVFKEVKKAVEESVDVATKLVDATRALRDLQQELTVTNAELTKELEGQKRIAEDTTLDYETRKTALEEVNRIQIQLAENVATQAKAEEDLLKVQISQEANYEKREELETQLAEKTAERINSELTLQTVKQEADKVSRELETEEVARKTEVNAILAQLDLDRIEDTFLRAQEELRIEEEALLEQLRLKKASDEEIAKVEAAFIAKRKKLKKEETDYNKKLDEEENTAKLQVISSAFKAIASIVGEQSIVGKIAAVSGATIDTFVAANNALANTPLPPPFPQIAAGIAYAAGIANVRSILATPVPGGGSAGGAPSLGGAPAVNPIEVGTDTTTLQAPEITTVQPAMRAYVVSGDVNTAQEADARLNRRRSLG